VAALRHHINARALDSSLDSHCEKVERGGEDLERRVKQCKDEIATQDEGVFIACEVSRCNSNEHHFKE
jgi:hypothetical protein